MMRATEEVLHRDKTTAEATAEQDRLTLTDDPDTICSMKPYPIILAILAPLVALGQPGGQERKERPFRNAATHDELAKRLKYAQNIDPMKKLTPKTGDDPSKARPQSSLRNDSDILCFNGVATFVPKRAILAKPSNIEERLKLQKGSRIVSWMEFLTLNRGWIRTIEVDIKQAK